MRVLFGSSSLLVRVVLVFPRLIFQWLSRDLCIAFATDAVNKKQPWPARFPFAFRNFSRYALSFPRFSARVCSLFHVVGDLCDDLKRLLSAPQRWHFAGSYWVCNSHTRVGQVHLCTGDYSGQGHPFHPRAEQPHKCRSTTHHCRQCYHEPQVKRDRPQGCANVCFCDAMRPSLMPAQPVKLCKCSTWRPKSA